MMNHETYGFGGMHVWWWIIWVFLMLWIFAAPYKIPGQRTNQTTPMDILKKRLALGEIDKKEYQEKKELIKAK